MIRLNVFFEKKEEVKVEEINALCKELVEKSLKDNGNIAYDYFTSGTRNGVMMICETWENEEVLKSHATVCIFHEVYPAPELRGLFPSGEVREHHACAGHGQYLSMMSVSACGSSAGSAVAEGLSLKSPV